MRRAAGWPAARRRVVLAGGAAVALAGAALAAWATLVEPRRLVVRRRELALPGWPRALDGLRVALVSDFHAGAPHMDAERVGRVARRVAAESPDVVLLLGDYVDPDVTLGGDVAPEQVARALTALGPRHGSYAVLGNHDWMHDAPHVARALERAGVTVIENDARRLDGTAAPLWLAGVADESRRDADVDAALAGVPAGDAVVLLSHDPDVFPRVPARVALTVSGHTHGGQVDVPGLRARVMPSRYGERFKDGHVVEGGRHLYVTSGVGTSSHPIRFRVPPEIVVLTLRA